MAQQQRADDRPALHISRSFTRMPSSPTSPRQKRASTLQTPSGIPAVPSARVPSPPSCRSDIFEHGPSDDEDASPHPPSSDDRPHNFSLASSISQELRPPATYNDLPIEIKSLTERFLDSLSAKVHDKPQPADALSDIFQSFYDRAASQINVHIASLASRVGRQASPSANTEGSRKRANSAAKLSADTTSSATSGGEMLTATEITHRRRARRVLELQRLALEEAVERVVCERVYTSLYRHPSTDDEARDEKLRSRIAALRVVGIGLKDLQQTPLPAAATTNPDEKVDKDGNEDIDAALAPAREALGRMSGEHFPAGKLACLKSAHQRIVDVLAQYFPSSASADEVLPTLIYTLMTCPPAGVEAVSNLGFVQRFRARARVEGEAAYCLVNLEAAVAFLETVDLPSLRADEGPGKGVSLPKTLKPDLSPVSANATEVRTHGESTSNDAATVAKSSAASRSAGTSTTAAMRPKFEQRRLSSLVQAQADRLEAGRDEFLRTADKIYDSINGTLDSSLQFVFGRFGGRVARPKTLEEARRLVSSSAPEMESGRSSPGADPLSGLLGVPSTPATSVKAGALEQLVGSRGMSRERSVDSTVSGGSGKRVAFSEKAGKVSKVEVVPGSGSGGGGGGSGNIFTSINPLNKFTIMPGFARFGRANSAVSTPPSDKGLKSDAAEHPLPPAAESFPILEKVPSVDYSDCEGGDELNAREALAALRQIAPPRRRFLEVRGAAELRIGEVEELLREYRRLAKAIGEAVVE
ncbi:MAG: hypothetical protein FE78DRAFT_155058 [Acidomyces sp. 'richmondensis']|nr:MAG: hypothetical protein FE78DRAFT_155058 [Acidomyces sp. 'richmondensis']